MPILVKENVPFQDRQIYLLIPSYIDLHFLDKYLIGLSALMYDYNKQSKSVIWKEGKNNHLNT
jgi:hypothetical protein